MSYQPLTGLRVLDLARLIPGDLASRKLADLGAEVVKVEPPGVGDYLRVLPPRIGEVGVHHWNLNRGKRSIQLDIHSAQGRETFLALADVADAILEVSIPGRYLASGIDFAQLRANRPSLVVCSLSGFGQTGPLATLPSHGMNIDALAGCVTTQGKDGRLKIDYSLSTSVANELGALNAALATTAALLGARTTGQGEWIDISCWDAGVEIQRSALARSAAGQSFDVNEMADSVLYNLYRCADGQYVVFCAIEEKFWRRFCEGIQRPDLVARWQGPLGGVDHRQGDEGLRTELDGIFATLDSSNWFRRFLDWQIPGCPLMRGADLLDLEHMKARGLVQQRDSSPVAHVADPIRWMSDGSRPGDHAAHSRELGADTEAVLREWLGPHVAARTA